MIISIILAITLTIGLSRSETILSGMEPFCSHDSSNGHLDCTEFQSFKELDFTRTKIKPSVLNLKPSKALKLELNSDLNLTGLSMSWNKEKPPKIVLSNLFSFDQSFNPFPRVELFNNTDRIFDLKIANSQLLFLLDFNCNWTATNMNDIFIFSGLNVNSLVFQDVLFFANSSICPIYFKQSRIKTWTFDGLNPVYYSQAVDLNESSLNIHVDALKAEFGYERFLNSELNGDNLLNKLIFSDIKSLELNFVGLEKIALNSFEEYPSLMSIRILNQNLDKLFQNGLGWMKYLNKQRKEAFQFEISFSERINSFIFDESKFCTLKDFPHDNLILLVFDTRRLSNDFDNALPCSCPIYWLYQNYTSQESLPNNTLQSTRTIPHHCLNISSVLIQEQNDFCQNTAKIDECNRSESTGTQQFSTTSISRQAQTICLPKLDPIYSSFCNCSIEPSGLNALECSNIIINQTEADYSTDFKWNYISFTGSAVQALPAHSFRNLSLAENATLLLSNVNFIDSDVFSNETKFDSKFRFVIQNSSLNILDFKYPFRFANMNQLEFIDCFFDRFFAVVAFDGVQANTFLVKRVQENSRAPFFRFGRATKAPVIRSFQLVDIGDTFSRNSPISLFGLDGGFLNLIVFGKLEELEVRNTRLDVIDGEIFTLLEQLKTVRLENVNLVNVIKYFYNNSLFSAEAGSSDFQPIKNWITNETHVERVYLGHEFEQGFKFENEYLCYFLEQTESTTIFIYDNLDSASGVECTCTIFWIYRYFDFEKTDEKYGDDLKYIPNCIKKLRNRDELKLNLDMCLNGNDPLEFCRLLLYPPTTPSTIIEVETTYITQTTVPDDFISSTITSTTELTAVSDEKTLQYLKNIWNGVIALIALIALVSFFILLVALILIFRCLSWRKKTNPQTSEVTTMEYGNSTGEARVKGDNFELKSSF